jgi:hypothetical protein
MEKVSTEDLKVIISSLLEQKDSKKFNSIVDIGTFLWKVVHKIIETTKNENLKLQQKEDILVQVSGDVINFLEENGMIAIELAEKSRTLLKSVDTFLDVLIGLYSFVSVNEVLKNPTRENCIKSVFSILSCFSAKVDSQQTRTTDMNNTKMSKIEIIEETTISGTGLVNENEKVEEISDAVSVPDKKDKIIVVNSNILNTITEE